MPTGDNTTRSDVADAATRLRSATSERTPVAPVRDLLAGSAAAAYEVQQINVVRRLERGDRVVGRKIGLTAPAVQRQLGVDQPDFGTLLASMQVDAGDTVDVRRLLQPRIEAEVAFVIAADVHAIPPTASEMLRLVSAARVALEIVDSRIAGWDISFLDTVADNASSGLFVLGDELALDPESLTRLRMRMTRNGVEVSSGRGADCLGGPLNSLHWLARTMLDRRAPLRAGDIILSGALGPMCDVRPADQFSATFDDAHRLDVSFSQGASS